MPLCYGILVELYSQNSSPRGEGLPTLTEYQPPPPSLARTTLPSSSSTYVPEFWDEENSVVNAYVATQPGANFWISYKIFEPLSLFEGQGRQEPNREGSQEKEEQYFVMKLFIGNVHLVTWSCGERQGWQGKTMWGLYEDPDSDRAKEPKIDVLGRGMEMLGMTTSRRKKALQKRLLCFSAPPRAAEREQGEGSTRPEKKLVKKESWGSLNTLRKKGLQKLSEPVPERFLEIKVYRAQGMRRVPTQVAAYDATEFEGASAKGIDMANGGVLQQGQPRRYYQFALIDPRDQPLVTFRYFYRTYDELRSLGVDVDNTEASNAECSHAEAFSAQAFNAETSNIEGSESSSTITQRKSAQEMSMRGRSNAENRSHGKGEHESENKLERSMDSEEVPRTPATSPKGSNGSSPLLSRLYVPPTTRPSRSQNQSGCSPKKENRVRSRRRNESPEWVIKLKDSIESIRRKAGRSGPKVELDDAREQEEATERERMYLTQGGP